MQCNYRSISLIDVIQLNNDNESKIRANSCTAYKIKYQEIV